MVDDFMVLGYSQYVRQINISPSQSSVINDIAKGTNSINVSQYNPRVAQVSNLKKGSFQGSILSLFNTVIGNNKAFNVQGNISYGNVGGI